MKIIDVTRKQGKAYEGDTYLEGCARAMKASPSWVRAMLAGALLAAAVDLSNFHKLVAQALQVSNADLTGWVVAAAAVFAYVSVGFGIGNPLRKYRAFGEKEHLLIAVACTVGVVLAIAVVTVFRCGVQGDVTASAEAIAATDVLATGTSSLAGGSAVMRIDPIYATLFYTAMMAIGALMSAVYSYYRYDAVAEKVYDESRAALAHDGQVYDSTFQSIMCDAAEESALEEREREIEGRMADAVLRINTIATQMAMVLDPADAYEVAKASRIVSAFLCGEQARGGEGQGERNEPIELKLAS